MKRNYEISGMTCGGCVSNVKRALLLNPEISEAEVKLNPPEALLTMNKPISIEELQTQLTKAGRYSIKEVALN